MTTGGRELIFTVLLIVYVFAAGVLQSLLTVLVRVGFGIEVGTMGGGLFWLMLAPAVGIVFVVHTKVVVPLMRRMSGESADESGRE
jgi:hypothetical protein